jgi:pimeloyl-ACP methyl ester carboxylesterase
LALPILALCGDEDMICPPELHREIAETAQNATLKIVSGAGHFVLLEAPAASQA